MRFYWALILRLLALLPLAKPEVVIDVSVGSYGYHFHFSRTSFEGFHTCLSNFWTYSCTVSLTWLKNWRHYSASPPTTHDATYEEIVALAYNYYECTRNSHPSTVYCVRLSLEASENLPPSDSDCQYFHLRKTQPRDSKNLECVNIIWNMDQHISDIATDSEPLSCGLCETTLTTAVTTTAPTTTITTSTDSSSTATTFDKRQGDNPSEDSIALIVGIVIAVIVVLLITGIIIVIWWRRKRNSKLPSTSHHYTTSTGAVSQNYENTNEMHGHVNGCVASVPNTYVTADSESTESERPRLQSGQAVVDSYVSAEEVIQKKRAAAAKNSETNNQGVEYSSIDQDVPDAVVYPVNGPHNKDNRSDSNLSSTTPVSTTYSRLGEPVRNIKNPYDALQNPIEYSVAKSTPANSNTSTQYSLAGPTASPSSTQDSDISHNSTSPTQPTNKNSYGYEEVGVNNMAAPVATNDYEESPTHAFGDNKDGAEAPKEPDYTNFPVKEPVAAKNDYAKLGEPVRNIQNPYDVMVNQNEDGPEESTSQAPPNSADDPYSLARPTLR